MSPLPETAPSFVAVAHRIVYATVATADSRGRPRSRLVHAMWEWDGERLVGWVGSMVTPMKAAHVRRTPYASVNYWDPAHDVATAECRAQLLLDDESCVELWEKFKALPEPLGYDGATIPPWKDGPTSPAYGVLRLEPWRLRVFPASLGRTGEGEILTWHEDEPLETADRRIRRPRASIRPRDSRGETRPAA